MTSYIENNLVRKYIVKSKQDRYIEFLQSKKNRKKFLDNLYHFKDFNWQLFQRITGNQDSIKELIREKIIKKTLNTNGHIISANVDLDGQTYSQNEAINRAVGQEATIIVFGDIDMVYYEAEAFDGQYLTI